MAECIAIAIGRSGNREAESARLGNESVTAKAATWNTFVSTTITNDGATVIKIERKLDGDGRDLLGEVVLLPENADDRRVVCVHGVKGQWRFA